MKSTLLANHLVKKKNHTPSIPKIPSSSSFNSTKRQTIRLNNFKSRRMD